MNVIEKADKTTGTAARAGDLDRFRLRRFIEDLVAAGEVERRDAPVDLAGIAEILDGNPRAVHFRAVGPERQELVGNVVSSRGPHRPRFRRGAGAARRRNPAPAADKPEIVEVTRAEAPVQQVVAHRRRRRPDGAAGASPARPRRRALHFGLDRLRASIPRTGWTNVGIRRLMLRGRRETGVDLVSPSDLRALYEASARAASRCR